MRKPVFSIILPLYKQEDQIKEIIKSLKGGLENFPYECEVIIVINGNDNDSLRRTKKLIRDNSRFLVFSLRKPGWGRAVKFGIGKAKGEYVCYTNSARTETTDLLSILKYALISDVYLVKASRIVRASVLRKIGSTIYNMEFRILFRIAIWDVNGTPKVIPFRVLTKVGTINSNGDLFDAELIIKCNNAGVNFIDIPVVNNRRRSGKSTTNVVSAIKMYFGLILLWRNEKKKI